ncbi:MAG TPA: phosphoribosyl-AMP cyclohydrolase [Thermomicrobiales bacterium]|nr:phosphoribosyl-AMP cyclohydrolase [Thermomicrobiales bacterium]
MTDSLPLTFDQNGLVPAVIQDADTDDVLMIGFMNDEALAATRRTGQTHFWSRSRSKLWHKGETSGHVQHVEEILVNCELNSLLIKVRQVGAVCHEGYATCFYRRLDDDNALAVIRERVFDPVDIYGGDGLESLTRQWFGAYLFLWDNDLAAVSGTSARLRAEEAKIAPRIADELRELAGVLDGTHGHTDPRADLLLEGSQVLYWVALAAVRANVGWEELRPDRALMTADDSLSRASAAHLLRAEAEHWTDDAVVNAPRLHAVVALVAQACCSAGVEPVELVEADLAELRGKPYLSVYFQTPATSN